MKDGEGDGEQHDGDLPQEPWAGEEAGHAGVQGVHHGGLAGAVT